MSYIEREKLLQTVGKLESLARERVYDTPTNSPAYQRYSTQMIERASFIDVIKEQPIADVVEVVRCKDCKYVLDHGMAGLWCDHPDNRNPCGCRPNDFCNDGKRREDGN